jgi:hypothetical protein
MDLGAIQTRSLEYAEKKGLADSGLDLGTSFFPQLFDNKRV